MKYILDKSSKKFICPNCNKKRFVRFIDIMTNEYLSEKYGRCDRETNCGYFTKPNIENCNKIAIPFLLKNSNKPNENGVNYLLQQELQQKVQQQLQQNQELLQFFQNKTLQNYCNNNLYLYLTSLFDEIEVETILKKYKVGTSKNWNGANVFWQNDNCISIRTGKIMLFDNLTGKRIKEPYSHISWVHKKVNFSNFKLEQCLFGLHLVTNCNKIAIVESEKTAIIMHLFLPEYIWLATGSKQNFKSELLLPIKDLNIIAFPDKSEYYDWKKKSVELNEIGYNITVSDYIEKLDCENGTDLADIYINTRKQNFNNKFSKDELIIIDLAKKNETIFELIQTFDLVDSFDNPIDINKLKNNVSF